LKARIEPERGLYAEAARRGTGEFRLNDAGGVTFVRLRPDGAGGLSSETVTRAALLKPGDVLEVRPSELASVPVAPPGTVNPESLPPSGAPDATLRTEPEVEAGGMSAAAPIAGGG